MKIDTGFRLGEYPGFLVGTVDSIRNLVMQARALFQQFVDVQPLDSDGPLPTFGPLFGLVSPFQQMSDEHRKSADQFPLLTSAHGFQFLGHAFQVQLGQPAFPQQSRRFLKPSGIIVQEFLGTFQNGSFYFIL
jgi:hypothetical protein